jgi:hypothetical protein
MPPEKVTVGTQLADNAQKLAELTALLEKAGTVNMNQDPANPDPAPVSIADLTKMAQEGRLIDQDGNKIPPDGLRLEFNQSAVAKAVGQLDGLAGGLPVGSALAGGFVGLLASEIIDGLMSTSNDDGSPNLMNTAVKLGGAYAAFKFLPKYMGRMPAIIAGSVLLIGVARDFFPLDDAIANIVNRIPSFGNRFSNTTTVLNQRGPAGAHSFSQVDPGQRGAGVDRFANLYQ